MSQTALYGAVLGWFVGVTEPHRFYWLFSRCVHGWGGRVHGCGGSVHGCGGWCMAAEGGMYCWIDLAHVGVEF